MSDQLQHKRQPPKQQQPDKRLSAAFVRNASEPGHYSDGNCLYLVIGDDGSRKWVQRLTIHGRRHDLGLGSQRLVTLAEAREEALRLRKIARQGGDPLTVRRQERHVKTVPTFEKAAREVHQARAQTFRNERHAEQWISTLEKYVFPQLGTRRVDSIDSGDVLKILSPIWIEIPETARRIRQRMQTVFRWAKAAGLSGDNPVDGIAEALPKHNLKQQHHPALAYAELPAFIQKLRSYEGVATGLGLEFLILTASRTSEVLLAKWTEIDFDGRTWIIPAGRMKARVEHRVPLAARAIEILREAKAISDGGDYIFPGSHLHKPLSNMTFTKALRLMKYGHITTHGFRSTFRDWAEEKTNFPNSVVEAALAHTIKNKVEAAYLRTKLFDKRVKLMDAWTGFATAPAGKVIGSAERFGA